MARAIIHNSDYAFAYAAKAAIDRYFAVAQSAFYGTSETRRKSNLAKGADNE